MWYDRTMSKKNKERKKATSCGGVVWRRKDNRLELLLIRQFANKDRWGIPKGHVHKGETHIDCALREIKEETGVDVELGVRLPDVTTTYRDEDKTVMSWLSRVIGNDKPSAIGPESEVADARWFRIDELPEIHIYQRSLIAAAVDLLFKMIEGSAPEKLSD